VDAIPNFDDPTVEFLILADHVEAVHGKLYMMGGGWENIAIHDFESPVTLEMAVSVQVPWNATNKPHPISVTVETADGEILGEVGGNILAGRPATIEHGATQRTMLAMKIPVTLPEPGTYVIVATLNDEVAKRVTFRALAAHAPATPTQ
jgi:hypothetical protein